MEHPWRKFKHPASPLIDTGTVEMWSLHLLRRPDLPLIKNLAEKNKMTKVPAKVIKSLIDVINHRHCTSLAVSEVMTSVCTSFSLTSAFPSRRRAAESSSRTQDLMLPPSLRSRNHSAGHLAPRRPIPPKLRRVCLVVCGPLLRGAH